MRRDPRARLRPSRPRAGASPGSRPTRPPRPAAPVRPPPRRTRRTRARSRSSRPPELRRACSASSRRARRTTRTSSLRSGARDAACSPLHLEASRLEVAADLELQVEPVAPLARERDVEGELVLLRVGVDVGQVAFAEDDQMSTGAEVALRVDRPAVVANVEDEPIAVVAQPHNVRRVPRAGGRRAVAGGEVERERPPLAAGGEVREGTV